MNVPATDLSGLTASSYTVTATVSDKAGNPASADHALAVDVTAPDLTINTVAEMTLSTPSNTGRRWW